MTRRQRDDGITKLVVEEPIRSDEQRIDWPADEARKGGVCVALAADVEDLEPQPECIRRNPQVSDLGLGISNTRACARASLESRGRWWPTAADRNAYSNPVDARPEHNSRDCSSRRHPI